MAKEEAGTNEAFEILVNSPYFWSLTGLPTSVRRDAAYKLRNGLSLTLDRKEELLAKAGFLVKQEKIWKLPSGS